MTGTVTVTATVARVKQMSSKRPVSKAYYALASPLSALFRFSLGRRILCLSFTRCRFVISILFSNDGPPLIAHLFLQLSYRENDGTGGYKYEREFH